MAPNQLIIYCIWQQTNVCCPSWHWTGLSTQTAQEETWATSHKDLYSDCSGWNMGYVTWIYFPCASCFHPSTSTVLEVSFILPTYQLHYWSGLSYTSGCYISNVGFPQTCGASSVIWATKEGISKHLNPHSIPRGIGLTIRRKHLNPHSIPRGIGLKMQMKYKHFERCIWPKLSHVPPPTVNAFVLCFSGGLEHFPLPLWTLLLTDESQQWLG